MPASFGKAKNMSIEFERLKLLVFPIGKDKFLQITQQADAPDIRQNVANLIAGHK